MSTNRPTIRIPASAVQEFHEVEQMDWSEGITLSELLEWINTVTARFRPKEIGDDSRASQEFSPRTFRHYQTLGCIDAPQRHGKRVVYRFRHYVQALLLRKFIWERIPSEKIASIMSGLSTEETKQLLFQGIEIVAKNLNSSSHASSMPIIAEAWKRIGVLPGIELHISANLPKPKPAELKQIIALLETSLRRNL